MAYRFRERYQAVLGKRRQLREAGLFSVPDEPGSRVAILVPFLEELVYDERDSSGNFEKQTAELAAHYTAREREAYHVMGATAEDFEQALTDTSVSTVVVEGFGNFSAVAVPFQKDRNHDARYGYLDWQHLAAMSTHLKLGKFVMYTCSGFLRQFNPPLASGVVSSFRNIQAPSGLALNAIGMQDNEPLIRSITAEDELTYDEIRERFKAPRYEDIPEGVPDAVYAAARGLRQFVHRHLAEAEDFVPPRSTPIPTPDLRQYL
jgi:hypothetical protein